MSAGAARSANGHFSRAVLPLSIAPGRVRVRVTSLRDQPVLASRLEDRIAGDGAVRRVRANVVTGSVLIFFDPARTRPRRLISEIGRYLGELRPSANGGPPRDANGWHADPPGLVVARLGTSTDVGLTSREASDRLTALGANRLPAPQPKSALDIISGHLTSLPVVLLGGAAALSLGAGAVVDAAVILAVVAANAAVGYLTESRVERTLASLQDGSAPPAVVRRDGEEAIVPAASLVPGDVLLLRPGADVLADARVMEVTGLTADQSALTGESLPVPKTPAPAPTATVLPDRANMVYAGTRIVEGSGVAVVTATGRGTEIGHVRALLADTTTPPTPLERQLEKVGRVLVGVSLSLCGVTLGLGVLRGVPALEMLRTVISLAVAAVPEGLPAVATTTLALGMQRMMGRGMLVRRLAAVESLGATTVICADKTGTLTENRMSVDSWYLGGREYRRGAALAAESSELMARALTIGALCNEAELANGGADIRGSSTEGALLRAALAAGIDYRAERERYPLLGVRRRGDGDNWMATVHARG